MYDSDDDIPPSLVSLPQQVTALEKKQQPPEKSPPSANETEDPTAIADVVCPAKKAGNKPPAATGKSAPFRKGFLSGGNPKPRKKQEGKRDSNEVPFLKGQSQNTKGGGKGIPEMFRIQEAQEYQRFKQDLTEKLKPNEDTMKEVEGNPMLVDAFSDPEIMAAVGEVASNPARFEKYKNNPKIVSFYEQFGKVLGKQLETKEGR